MDLKYFTNLPWGDKTIILNPAPVKAKYASLGNKKLCYEMASKVALPELFGLFSTIWITRCALT